MIFQNCYTLFHQPLGEWNLRQFWNIAGGIDAKYHVQIMLLFVYTTSRKGFVIFTCRYFKLSWNTTALSQSNCRNFSCRSINTVITDLSLLPLFHWQFCWSHSCQTSYNIYLYNTDLPVSIMDSPLCSRNATLNRILNLWCRHFSIFQTVFLDLISNNSHFYKTDTSITNNPLCSRDTNVIQSLPL